MISHKDYQDEKGVKRAGRRSVVGFSSRVNSWGYRWMTDSSRRSRRGFPGTSVYPGPSSSFGPGVETFVINDEDNLRGCSNLRLPVFI